MISQQPVSSELSTNAPPPIRIWLFGAFRVNVQGVDLVNFRSNKSRALLAYLLLTHPPPPLRSDLDKLFWPDYLAQSARGNLRQSLSNLRATLAPFDLIAADYTHVRVKLDPTLIWCDVWQFMELLARCQRHPHQSLAACPACTARLQQALDLYRGGLLENFPAVDSPPFHAWLQAQRQRFATALAEAQAALAKSSALPQTPSHNLPLPVTRFIGRETAIAEVAARLLGSGQPASRLLTLTGAGGAGKTRLARQVAAAVQPHFPDGVWLIDLAPVTDPTLLPEVIADSLRVHGEVGRPLVASLLDWLQSKHLLLLLDNCEHLIDSCADFAVRALQAGPAVHLLATSREVLNIAGEAIYPVVPLTLPPTLSRPLSATAPQAEADDTWLQALQQAEAARLFSDRAALVQPTFRVTRTNAPALAQICHQLDGLPLALELAAACVKVLSVEQIAERMGNRFRLLCNGPRDAVSRHQTLRASVDWSYDLLTKPERVLLRRLALFTGGWTLAAAEAICADDSTVTQAAATGAGRVEGGVGLNALAQGAILPLLTHLVEKSLVTWDGNQEKTRYHLLATIRHYAQEKLAEADETLWLGRRHFTYFLQMARETEGLMQHGQRPLATAYLRADHDNLRAALLWACRHDGEAACHLVGLLRWFWLHADFIVESEGWHQRVLALPATATLTRGRALATLSHASLQIYTNRLNPQFLQEAVANFQALNDPVYLCEAVLWLGLVLPFLGKAEEARRLFSQYEPLLRQAATPLVLGQALVHWAKTQPDFAHAQPLYEEALTLGQQWQEPVILANAYLGLGDWAQGAQEYDRARAYHLEGLACMRRVGTTWLIATALQHVGTAIGWSGDCQAARSYFAEGLHLARTVGYERYMATVLAQLAQIAARQGQFDAAEGYLAEAVAICRARMLPHGLILCLIVYASLRYWQGEPALAVRLLALEAVRKTPFPFDARLRAETLAAARYHLSEAEFTAAQAAGQSLTVETALVYACASVRTSAETMVMPVTPPVPAPVAALPTAPAQPPPIQ
ncbi:MAG: hypothetical protein DYG89_16040 [Caldilinea sp. CFX5]|nr:hypothetical protein [Caldilinea sp. CFX5]